MSKKVSDMIDRWSKSIGENFDRQREIDNKLEPNVHAVRTIVSYGEGVQSCLRMIETVSQMAHQGIITFEVAQKIMDVQRKSALKDMKYLEVMLKDEDHE